MKQMNLTNKERKFWKCLCRVPDMLLNGGSDASLVQYSHPVIFA